MDCAVWPRVSRDLASTRRGASVFLDNLEDMYGAVGRKNWITKWTKIGDAHCRLAELNIAKRAFDEASEAWLCALTAFEVARRLVDEEDAQHRDVSARIEASVLKFGLSRQQKLERVQIACDQADFFAYYLRAPSSHLRAPAVICISSEEETEVTLLGRLLPVAIGRGVSVLFVSHDDISNDSLGQGVGLLSCCLDYLSARSDVDANRIGIYGEGLSAALATDFAASDRRIAAAVCDGGLWTWARIMGSIGWMTRAADVVDEEIVSARRSRIARQLRCPVLVVAGGRGLVSVSEGIKLQAECAAARIDMELTIPRMTSTPAGEIENFVTADDCIFAWLQQKLAYHSVA